jgi:Na+-transporting methylmalonyl-CoA/oxaloacetate decarboxylase gamma subunit
MNFLELFFRGGEVTGLGIIAVFAVIAVIFFVIKGLGVAASPAKKTVKNEDNKVAEEKATASAPATVTEEVPAEEASDDLELIAILAAAVSAYTGEPVTKFRVVSFKHIK